MILFLFAIKIANVYENLLIIRFKFNYRSHFSILYWYFQWLVYFNADHKIRKTRLKNRNHVNHF